MNNLKLQSLFITLKTSFFIKKSNKKSNMTSTQKTTLSISQEGIMGSATT
jgi:hypothetical protein